MNEIFKMAGEKAVHAVWSVSDGEILVPILGVLDQGNDVSMERIAFSDSEEAIAYGYGKLDANESNAKGAVFIMDGFVTLDEGRFDALIVQIRGYDDYEMACTLALPYRPDSHEKGFAIYRPKLLEYPEEAQASQEANLDAFFDGIEGHELAYPVWQAAYADSFDSDPAGAQGEGDLTPEEWELLMQAPYLVFLTVAAADGVVDKKEVKSLTKILAKAKEQPSVLLQKVLAESAHKAGEIINGIIAGGGNTIDALQQVQELVDSRFDADEAMLFKVSLLLISKEVAEASGGGFLGFGKKISKEEKMAMAAIALTLKLNDQEG